MRGRPGWWRLVLKGKGTVELMPTGFVPNYATQQNLLVNKDVLLTAEEVSAAAQEVSEEKRRFIKSHAFVAFRLDGIKRRSDVKDRNQRIQKIAEHIQTRGWANRPNAWIAVRLAAELGQSVNTLRADTAQAKKNLMGSRDAKK